MSTLREVRELLERSSLGDIEPEIRATYCTGPLGVHRPGEDERRCLACDCRLALINGRWSTAPASPETRTTP